MKMLDLFSGIGGFSLAADQVWPGIEHTFVEYDPFCQAVLRKHWPQAKIYGDIRRFVADASSLRCERTEHQREGVQRSNEACGETGAGVEPTFLLTGGFPCQPFSTAGQRKGTADDRYLWPPMLECVRLYKPTWVIAENVRGLVSWNDGLVLETVCADLEAEGYEVQPFIIPACAANAPHRRERVWIVAHATFDGGRKESGHLQEKDEREASKRQDGRDAVIGSAAECHARNSNLEGLEGHGGHDERAGERFVGPPSRELWEQPWREVALASCDGRLDDGLPRRVDGLSDRKLGDGYASYARWRKESLKAYGNAIVPQVAVEIMKAIRQS